MRLWPKLVLGIFLAGMVSASTLQTEVVKLNQLQCIQTFLGIPETLAHVTDASGSVPLSSIPEFILIQDVHRHSQVQAQIATLIEQGYDHWGVRKVFLEGAFTVLDLTVFHRVPTKTRSLLTARLVKDGSLSGPELAAVRILEREWRDPPVSPFQLFGLDDPELYRKNIQAYQAVISQRDRALQELVTIRRMQNSMHLPPSSPLIEQLDRTEALLHLKLTPVEYAAYSQDKEAVPSTPALDPAVHAAEEFYRLAQLRSETFLKQASEKAPASTAPRILVVGGFHTAYMSSLLRQEGHSFVVLCPKVGQSDDDPIYEKHLQETASILAEAPRPASH